MYLWDGEYLPPLGLIAHNIMPITLRRVITEGTLEPCHLLLVLSTCPIALVGVASNITKSKNIIVRHVDNTR